LNDAAFDARGRSVSAIRIFVACVLAATLGGCGLYVPEKNLIQEIPPDKLISPEGAYENKLVGLIRCETAQGLLNAYQAFHLPWLETWVHR
jgi:hypothetical protein